MSNELHPELEKYRAFPAQEAMEDDILIPFDEALAAQRAIERDALQWAAERMCGLCRRGEEPLRLYGGQMVHYDQETPTAHEVCEATQITYRIAQLKEGS